MHRLASTRPRSSACCHRLPYRSPAVIPTEGPLRPAVEGPWLARSHTQIAVGTSAPSHLLSSRPQQPGCFPRSLCERRLRSGGTLACLQPHPNHCDHLRSLPLAVIPTEGPLRPAAEGPWLARSRTQIIVTISRLNSPAFWRSPSANLFKTAPTYTPYNPQNKSRNLRTMSCHQMRVSCVDSA